MTPIKLMVPLLLLAVVGVAALAGQRIDGGSSTLSWEIEPGVTRVNRATITDGGTVGADARVAQEVRVCVAGTDRCRNRELVCTSGTTATLDGVNVASMPAALTSFCGAVLGASPNFVTRRDGVFNAAGVKALLVGQ